MKYWYAVAPWLPFNDGSLHSNFIKVVGARPLLLFAFDLSVRPNACLPLALVFSSKLAYCLLLVSFWDAWDSNKLLGLSVLIPTLPSPRTIKCFSFSSVDVRYMV